MKVYFQTYIGAATGMPPICHHACEKGQKMDNINIEEYIKDLSPELQEKARACTSTDELLKLAQENKIPLPDEALEAVAGGKNGSYSGGIQKPLIIV